MGMMGWKDMSVRWSLRQLNIEARMQINAPRTRRQSFQAVSRFIIVGGDAEERIEMRCDDDGKDPCAHTRRAAFVCQRMHVHVLA